MHPPTLPPRTTRRWGGLVLLVLVLGLARPSAAHAEADPAAVDLYMRLSGMSQMFDRMGLGMGRAVVDGAMARGLRLGNAERERLHDTVAAAYRGDRMNATARAALGRSLETADLQAMQRWLESEAGLAVTQAESAGMEADLWSPDQLRAGEAARDAAGPVRRALLDRITAASRSVEATVSLAVNTMLGMQAGAASARPGEPGPEANALQSLSRQLRPAMEAFATQAAPRVMARLYAPVTEEHLALYADALETPEARRVTDAVIDAITRAMVEAAHRLGRGLVGPRDGQGT